MKRILTSIIILIGSITLAWSQAPTSGTHTWVLNITPHSSKHSLDSVTAEWAKNNIVLKFTKLQYIKNGTLQKVKGSVDVNANGTKASATFGSDKLESWEIKVTDKPSVSVKGK
jgi:hypothetical protein